MAIKGSGPCLHFEKPHNCYFCNQILPVKNHPNTSHPFNKTIDHILAKSRGGLNGPKVITCLLCNSWKGNKTLSEWQNVITFSLLNPDTMHPKWVHDENRLNRIFNNIERLKKYLISRYGGEAYMRLEGLYNSEAP